MSEYIYEHSQCHDHFGKPLDAPMLTQREEIVRCRDCRKSYKADEMFFCKMFSAMVEPWRFCSWGEIRGDESLIEFIEREGRKRDTND